MQRWGTTATEGAHALSAFLSPVAFRLFHFTLFFSFSSIRCTAEPGTPPASALSTRPMSLAIFPVAPGAKTKCGSAPDAKLGSAAGVIISFGGAFFTFAAASLSRLRLSAPLPCEIHHSPACAIEQQNRVGGGASQSVSCGFA